MNLFFSERFENRPKQHGLGKLTIKKPPRKTKQQRHHQKKNKCNHQHKNQKSQQTKQKTEESTTSEIIFKWDDLPVPPLSSQQYLLQSNKA